MNKIIGVVLILIGLFILVSGFQASNCQIDDVCLGMEFWFDLWNFDNMFIITGFVVFGVLYLIVGGRLLIK